MKLNKNQLREKRKQEKETRRDKLLNKKHVETVRQLAKAKVSGTGTFSMG